MDWARDADQELLLLDSVGLTEHTACVFGSRFVSVHCAEGDAEQWVKPTVVPWPGPHDGGGKMGPGLMPSADAHIVLVFG